MATLKETIAAKLPALLLDLSQAKVYLKSTLTVVLAGGATAAYEVVTNLGHEVAVFSPANVTAMRSRFITGAFLALLGLFLKSPLTNTHEASADKK